MSLPACQVPIITGVILTPDVPRARNSITTSYYVSTNFLQVVQNGPVDLYKQDILRAPLCVHEDIHNLGIAIQLPPPA